MATSTYALLVFTFFLPLVISHGVLIRPSPFNYLKNLQGYQKGDQDNENSPNIQYLKKYLYTFGYLSQNQTNDSLFDETLESAIKTYQLNFNLNPTGTLDSKTILTMSKPRCGEKDIMNGTTQMNSGKNSKLIDYAFPLGKPKWPASKKVITFRFREDEIGGINPIGPVSRSFLVWSNFTSFGYNLVDYRYADIQISFERLDHGDGVPFDGPRKSVGHGFPYQDGRLHFDADEIWSDDYEHAIHDKLDLMTVALHEIGHILGLAHSSDENAIMNIFY